MASNVPFTLREDFTYLQLETFGELMISLPNICRRKGAEDVSSAEIINSIARLAIDFEAEWSKMSAEDHDAAGEDWLEEIDKLANWIIKHLYDVLHNELEYGMYRAKKTIWGYSTRLNDHDLDPTVTWVSESRDEATSAMFEKAQFEIMRNVRITSTRLEFVGKSVENNGLPAIRVIVGGTENGLQYKLVSKLEDM